MGRPVKPSAGDLTVPQSVHRREQLFDTIGLGFLFWFIGYIASIILFSSSLPAL